MKIIIDVTQLPNTNSDILIWDNGSWKAIKKAEFLHSTQKQITALQEENKNLKKSVEEFATKVNGKLEEYHNILQILTKGE